MHRDNFPFTPCLDICRDALLPGLYTTVWTILPVIRLQLKQHQELKTKTKLRGLSPRATTVYRQS
jgi:hypothetical protein